jgi:hypothetical protein
MSHVFEINYFVRLQILESLKKQISFWKYGTNKKCTDNLVTYYLFHQLLGHYTRPDKMTSYWYNL